MYRDARDKSVARHAPHLDPRRRYLEKEKRQTACKPGSVQGRCRARYGVAAITHARPAPVWPFIWDVRCRTPHATYPRIGAENACTSCDARALLSGLAPGGVCRAASVTGRAVRSYRTLSPLPISRDRRSALCGTVPGLDARRTLSGTVFPWSPDFPPLSKQERPSGHLAAGGGRPLRDRSQPLVK